jgi:hypothetical protein
VSVAVADRGDVGIGELDNLVPQRLSVITSTQGARIAAESAKSPQRSR